MQGLYVHIPFCETKCIYCDFYSVESERTYDAFVDALVKEIHLRADATGDAGVFTSIFFGGGTPSLLSPSQLERIVNALVTRFSLSADLEFTAECNPGTVDREKLSGYRSLGVNRLSFGVQSFHEDDLKFLSRIHSVADAGKAVDAAHGAGFGNVNIDLMFSLPGQTPARWMHNLERARELETTHISCYSLTVEKGTPLAVLVDKKLVDLPGEDSDAGLFDTTMETLESWGFRQYEVSNYAKPGFECRHNLTYWRHQDYLGFGPSAHGTWKKKRYWNVSSLQAYMDRLSRKEIPAAGGEDLTPEILRGEYIFLRLRSEGIDLGEFRNLFGIDFLCEHAGTLRGYERRGFVTMSDDRVRLTKRGFLVSDELCAGLM